jgi:molybdenum cofactor cytidylyltransferase
MGTPGLSILIPAAGASKRLGQPKQLLNYNGHALIYNTVCLAQSITPLEIIVVTGAGADAVGQSLGDLPVKLVFNPRWKTGLGSSIALGASSVSDDAAGLMVLLCDQWRLQTEDIQTLAARWQSNVSRIVSASADGHCMPPVIFPSGCFGGLRALEGDTGARRLLKQHPDLLTTVVLKNAAFDLDTRSDLAQLKKSPV